MDINKINTIVLSGGGMNGIAFLGFFNSVFNKVSRSNITHYIGSSIGAGICFLINIGYTIDELTKIFLEYDFNTMVPDIKLDDLIFDLGVTNSEGIYDFLVKLTEFKEFDKDITFVELFNKTNIQLTITVSNITNKKLEYWNHINTPNFKVLQGLVISARIPLYTKPYFFNNNYYVDGGLINNYPINYIDINNIDCVIGAYIFDKFDINSFIQSEKSYKDFFVYINKLLIITLESKYLEYLDVKYQNRTIILDVDKIDTLDFTINNDAKINIINQSFNITNSYFDIH